MVDLVQVEQKKNGQFEKCDGKNKRFEKYRDLGFEQNSFLGAKLSLDFDSVFFIYHCDEQAKHEGNEEPGY